MAGEQSLFPEWNAAEAQACFTGPCRIAHIKRINRLPWGDSWLRGGIVLVPVPVNASRLPVLLASELMAILRSEVTSISGAIGPLLVMNSLLMRFQIVRSPSGDLTGGFALLDTRLLVTPTIVDVMTLVVGCLGEERGGG